MARKKADAHHGGAWKVAYADFVTAMMALFMVLWISAQDQKVLVATARYFQNPFNTPIGKSSGVMEAASDKAKKGSGEADQGMSKTAPQTDPGAVQIQFLNALAKEFYRLLHLDEDLSDKPIDIQVTSDGMRITLFDRARKPLFQEGNAEFTEWGHFIMQNLAWLVDRHRFHVRIEGHTRAGLIFPAGKDYSAWDLSSDRANAARRALTHYAVDPKMIEAVTGYADTRLAPGIPADSESNQRVTLSLSLGQREKKKADTPTTTAIP
jgi:chemotaxis protein MotB